MVSSNRTRKCRCSAGPLRRGMTSRSTRRKASPSRMCRSSLRTGVRPSLASATAARSSALRPPRTILVRSRLAVPGVGSTNGPVCPRNWRMVMSSSIRTPGGAYFASSTRSASRWRSRMLRPSAGATLAFGASADVPAAGIEVEDQPGRGLLPLVHLAVALDGREQLAEAYRSTRTPPASGARPAAARSGRAAPLAAGGSRRSRSSRSGSSPGPGRRTADRESGRASRRCRGRGVPCRPGNDC